MSILSALSNLTHTFTPDIPLVHPSAPNIENAYEPSAVGNKAPAKPVEGLANKIFEYGRKFLESPQFLGTGISLAPGAALGLRVEGSLHTKKSPLVENNPFRLAATTYLEKNNPRHSVVWTQTGGVLELGLGVSGTLPLTQFVGLQGGFIPSGLLRYRCIKPHVVGFFQSQASILAQNETIFPFCSANAKNLAAGAEFELSGQGRLRIFGALAANAGTPPSTIINAGAGASAFANWADAKEIGINILALDGKNKVRVTLHQLGEDVTQLGLMAYAGVVAAIGPTFPSIGQGLLQGGPTLLSSPVGDTLNNYYTSLSAQASTSERSKDTAIATFDLDLAQPEACKAFDEIMRLSCVEAEASSKKLASGVRLLKSAEQEAESRNEVSANFFGDKLYLYQALTNEKDGHFVTPDGQATIFRTAHFRQHERGWFEPTRDVLWESVSLQNGDDKEPKTFFRFRFQKDGELSKAEFEDYFGLADAMALNGRESEKHAHPIGPSDDVCKNLLTQTPNVTQITDVYYTSQGIRNMQKVSSEQAKEAYLQAIATVRKRCDLSFMKADKVKEPKLIELLDKYADEVRAGWFMNFGHARRLSEYNAQYKELCGREINSDAFTYSNACAFGRRITQLKTATDHRELEAFFVNLGKSKGFRYKCMIGALAKLAGENETLVHRHELGGGAVAFKYNDQGKLEAPSEMVTALLSKDL